jgi:hypothetical protein
LNPIFRDLKAPLGAGSRCDHRRVEERELTELLDALGAAGVRVRVDRRGILVAEGLTGDAPPHVTAAIETLTGREPAVKRVLANATLFRSAAVAARAWKHREARVIAGKLEARPSHRRSPDGSFAAAKAASE